MNTTATALATVILVMALLGVIMIVAPFFTIWSLNTLFGLTIPYSFKTWVAVNWLLLVCHGVKIFIKKSEE